MNNIFFNAHHAPIGAFATFTLGFPGASGGLGLELGKPANQNVFIGLESLNDGIFEMLPFYDKSGTDNAEVANYGIEHNVSKAGARLAAFAEAQIRRDFQLATDTWTAGDLTFTIYSLVRSVTDPKNGYWAWSGLIANGEAIGSKYYPRGVTAILWLEEV